MRSSVLTLAAVSCVAVASSARAADLYYFPAFAPVGNGVTENPKVRGAGALIFDDQSGTTTILLSVRHLQPNTTYGVYFGNDLNSSEPSNVFSTDSSGRSAAVVTIPAFIIPSESDTFFVIYEDVDHMNDFTPGEERAAGIPF